MVNDEKYNIEQIENNNYTIHKDGTITKTIVMKPFLVNGKPYINLCVDGKSVKYTLSRLVATKFVKNENPKTHKYIHYIDSHKSNCSAKNLTWVQFGVDYMTSQKLNDGKQKMSN